MSRKKLTKTELAACQALLGPPPVLSTENVENFRGILDWVMECLETSNAVEMLLVWDFVVATWELNRYVRHRALAVERWHAQSLQAMAHHAKLQQARKEERIDRKATEMGVKPADIGHLVALEDKVEDSTSIIDDILQRKPTEREHNRAIEKGITFLEKLDWLINRATARRNGALRELDLYRAGLGARVSAAVDNIIEGTCQDLTAPSEQPSSPPLVPVESETENDNGTQATGELPQ